MDLIPHSFTVINITSVHVETCARYVSTTFRLLNNGDFALQANILELENITKIGYYGEEGQS